MYRRYCGDMEGRRQGRRQSMEIVARRLPPWSNAIVIDWGDRATRAMSSNNFNIQSREALANLRPSDHWVVTCGMRCSGLFRAISPRAIISGVGTSIRFNVEINLGPPCVNIRGDGRGLPGIAHAPAERNKSRTASITQKTPSAAYLRPVGSP